MARPKNVSTGKCKGRRKDGNPCQADAVLGTELCMAHHKQAKRAADRPKPPVAGGPETFLDPDERGTYDALIEQLTREVKPRNMSERMGIDRFARALIQAGRYDSALLAGDKYAAKNLYFVNLTIQNWVKVLGVDRRLRIRREDEKGGHALLAKKYPWLFKGGKRAIELDRGDGQATASVPGPDNGRSRGVLPGDSGNGTSRETTSGDPESGSVPDETVG